MIIKGFKFGMLLQLAIGPVCLFIFQTASIKGFAQTMGAVTGVVIIDALFILAAILGIAAIIDKKNIKKTFRVFGSLILILFGLNTILNQFAVNLIPGIGSNFSNYSTNVFLNSIILTISNPLTILFWAGVFSSRITAGNLRTADIYKFGLGSLLSTFFFLSLTALAGSLSKTFLPSSAIQALNILIGLVLLYFGIRMTFKKIETIT